MYAFLILRCIVIIKLSMYSSKKTTRPPTRLHQFQYILLFCFEKNTFLKVFMCYVLSVFEKKMVIFLCFGVLFFFIRLLLLILYKQLSSSFQLSAVLGCSFDWFSTICLKTLILVLYLILI